ncbi:hypothetical protein IMZ48_43635 [Candidatus Bathyarchaeota archaeon]|nr:hypothetical protein [Candidatus Bathyarchaeota archaeon]
MEQLGSHRANDLRKRGNDDHHGGGNVLAKSERRGFETAIPLDNASGRRYLRAAATDSKGKVIGYTPVWDCSTGEAVAVDEE